jgi:hypothetical protein
MLHSCYIRLSLLTWAMYQLGMIQGKIKVHIVRTRGKQSIYSTFCASINSSNNKSPPCVYPTLLSSQYLALSPAMHSIISPAMIPSVLAPPSP